MGGRYSISGISREHCFSDANRRAMIDSAVIKCFREVEQHCTEGIIYARRARLLSRTNLRSRAEHGTPLHVQGRARDARDKEQGNREN